MSELISTCLFLAGIGAGFWLSERDARKKRGRWRAHTPSTDILKDYK